MTDVLVMPGVQTLRFTELTIGQKIARIEDMASMTGLTPEITADLLRRIVPESLAGWAAMQAWLRAEQAIAVRDATRVLLKDGTEASPEMQDAEFGGYKQAADDAICDLIHGINTGTARGRGKTSTGDWTA